jgi:hypothetical protein
MSGSPWQVNTQTPSIGEFNLEVYQNRLGFRPQEIAKLAKEGII